MAGESILAYLGLDTKGFEAKLGGATSSLAGFASKAAGFLGVSISVAGIEHLTKSAIEGGARVYDLGKRYDVSTDAIQRFGHAAELTGGSQEGVARGFNKLDISISRALGGNEKIIKSFGALGITLDDLRNMSPEEVMLKLGKSSLDAASLVTLLGKSALELRPTLKGLADGTIELGGAIDKHLIEQLKEADDMIRRFEQSVKVTVANRIQFWIFDTGLAFKSLGHSIAEASRVLHDFMSAPLAGNPLKALEEAMARAKGFAQEKTLWEKEMDKRDHGNESDQGELAAGARGKSKGQLAMEKQNAAASQIDPRSRMSLDEIAKRPAALDNTQSIQAWWAGEQARQAQTLYGTANQQAANQDFAGSKASLDRADQIKGGIAGIKEVEKPLTKADLDSSVATQHLASIDANLQLDE